jgi:hypothetical protein
MGGEASSLKLILTDRANSHLAGIFLWELVRFLRDTIRVML